MPIEDFIPLGFGFLWFGVFLSIYIYTIWEIFYHPEGIYSILMNN